MPASLQSLTSERDQHDQPWPCTPSRTCDIPLRISPSLRHPGTSRTPLRILHTPSRTLRKYARRADHHERQIEPPPHKCRHSPGTTSRSPNVLFFLLRADANNASNTCRTSAGSQHRLWRRPASEHRVLDAQPDWLLLAQTLCVQHSRPQVLRFLPWQSLFFSSSNSSVISRRKGISRQLSTAPAKETPQHGELNWS